MQGLTWRWKNVNFPSGTYWRRCLCTRATSTWETLPVSLTPSYNSGPPWSAPNIWLHAKEVFWPHMTNDVYTSVSNCSTCARIGTFPKLKREVQLFPTSGQLKLIAINIIRPLPRIANGNEYVVVMTYRNLKLKWATPIHKISSSYVAKMLFKP